MRSLNDIRHHFPLIKHFDSINQVYLDSGSTTQKPLVVLDAIRRFYRYHNANPRRGTSSMSAAVSEAVENVRQKTAHFIDAPIPASIVFTKSTTESINLVARGWAETHLKAGDEIVVSAMEHHSNLLPWQRVARSTGATLTFIPVDSLGQINLAAAARIITTKTRLVAITHVSNVFGAVVPIKEITALAHQCGAMVVVDGAQAIAHRSVSVTDLDVDFYAFSSHKMYGPAGVGVLYGKQNVLDETEPLLLGGGMIEHVTYDSASWDSVPYKFEGGTQNVADIVGFGAAIDYMTHYSFEHIARHEHQMAQSLIDALAALPDIRLYSASPTTIVSFAMKQVHPHDVAQVLDSHGMTIRSGHHCAEPLMQHLGVAGLVRVSFGLYNNQSDVNRCIEVVKEALKRFNRE